MAANTKAVVVDASFVLAFMLPDEYYEEVDFYFNQFKSGLINLIASSILPFEVTNSIIVSVLRKRISLEYAQDRLDEYTDYKIELRNPDMQEVFKLANKYKLTAYDASYMYLAQKNHLPLLTLDEKLEKLVV